MESQDQEQRRNEESLARTMGILTGRIDTRSKYQRNGKMRLPSDPEPSLAWLWVVLVVAVVVALLLQSIDAKALFETLLYPAR